MASVYDYEVGNELTQNSRKPIRKSIKSLYLQILHWQFLGVILVSNILFYFLYLKGKGLFSYNFFLYALILPFAIRLLIAPFFHLLKGYLPPKKRLILSLCFSGVILAFLVFSIVHYFEGDTYSSIKDKVCSVPRYFSSFSIFSTVEVSEVEFRLIPYARVFDVSDKKSDPKFLLESHHKSIRFERIGEYILRFDYMGNIYTKDIEIKSSGNYILYFDMRQNHFWFRAKGD